jgi:hypothetical protein
MDLLSLVTSGVNDNEVQNPDEDILGVVEGWQDDESHNPDVPAVSHKRGMRPFVFVPFEEVYTQISTAFPLEFRRALKGLETPPPMVACMLVVVFDFNYLS